MAEANVNQPSPWLKKVLIPFWVIQLLLMLFVFIIFIWIVAEEPYNFAVYQVLILILCAASMVLVVTEIILFARRNLKQLTYLIFQVVKTTIWFALFINALARGIVSQAGDGRVNTSVTWAVVVFGILFFAFLGSLIYSSIIFHRHRRNKRKGLNAQNITQNPYYNGPYGENGLSTANYTPVDSAYPSTPYPPTAAGHAPTIYGSERVETPLVGSPPSAPAYVVGELGESDRKSRANYSAMELEANREVYELSSAGTRTEGSRHGW